VRSGFHSLPVVDAPGRLVGLVTTTDVLRLVLNHDALDASGG
jgi:CBS domain-containing protein